MAITNKDVEKLKDVFATKDDLKVLKNDFINLKNEVLNSHDEIIKKLDDMRTEKLMLISRNREHADTIANHEERIGRLEKKVLV